MHTWADNIKMVEDERIRLANVAANNHYAGFGPDTANIFRNMSGLPEGKWEEKEEGQEQEQPEISHDRARFRFLDLKPLSRITGFLCLPMGTLNLSVRHTIFCCTI